MESSLRFPRFIAVAFTLTLVAAACSDDADDPTTIKLDQAGLTPDAADIQIDGVEGSTVGLTFATLDNEPADFDRYLGRPLVINFFAEWCAPCVREMPAFERVSQDLDDEISFVGISIDARPESARELIDATGVTYDIGWDPSEQLYAHFQGFSMPTTVFVDATGAVQRVHSGGLDDAALRERIDEDLL